MTIESETSPLTPRERAIEAAREALRGTREYQAGLAFGVPADADNSYSHALATAAMDAIWPIAWNAALEQAAKTIEDRANGAGKLIRHPEQTRLCADNGHDDRWCGTCAAMEDGMDLAADLLASLHQEAP